LSAGPLNGEMSHTYFAGRPILELRTLTHGLEWTSYWIPILAIQPRWMTMTLLNVMAAQLTGTLYPHYLLGFRLILLRLLRHLLLMLLTLRRHVRFMILIRLLRIRLSDRLLRGHALLVLLIDGLHSDFMG